MEYDLVSAPLPDVEDQVIIADVEFTTVCPIVFQLMVLECGRQLCPGPE